MRRNTHTGSQHFLRSPKLVESLFALTNINAGDTVYDIGAGSGTITSVLARRVRHVIAVENNPDTIRTLRQNIEDVHQFNNVIIKEGDYLTLPEPRGPYKIFANIPFSISAEIVRKFFNAKNGPESAYLIVQKQFGQKLVSNDAQRFTSQLGMLLGAEYAIRIVKNLQRNDFAPPPAVDTVFIELKKRPVPLIEKNTLETYRAFTEKSFSDQKFLSRQPLHVIGATPGLSPSRLTLAQWLTLFNSVHTRP